MIDNKSSHQCATCPIRHKTEWRDLSDPELEIVEQAKHARDYETGETIYHQGDASDGVYCIQTGLVGARYIDVDGNSALLGLNEAGSTVGYRSFLSKQPHSNSAEVLSPSFICFIEGAALTKLLIASPQMGERFLQHALADIGKTEALYARSLTGSVKSKFLHLIMVFYKQHGYQDASGNLTVQLPVKRTDIAEMIGAQPESISRLVRTLQNDGLLKFEGRKVLVTDMDAVLFDAGLVF